jgi:hypothetical protein
MAITVMLNVDLNGVTSTMRTKFYEELENKQWTKLRLTTTWTARFREGTTKDAALITTKSDVKTAALVAGVKDYEAAASLSDELPSQWNSA